jgi:hypothetical protein
MRQKADYEKNEEILDHIVNEAKLKEAWQKASEGEEISLEYLIELRNAKKVAKTTFRLGRFESLGFSKRPIAKGITGIYVVFSTVKKGSIVCRAVKVHQGKNRCKEPSVSRCSAGRT